MIEILISAVLLMTTMSLVGSVCFRVNLIWSDVNHQRVAVNELSNQLEQLTVMKLKEAEAALTNLEPSSICSRTLKSPVLSGKILEDDLGSRIVLQISWDQPVVGNPVELSGWIVSAGEEDSVEEKADEEKADEEKADEEKADKEKADEEKADLEGVQ